MERKRLDPDDILKKIKEEAEGTQRGHLKIFFGYAAGVGKTFTMLEAAHSAKDRGIDVVVGYIEPHTRPATTALLSGLEVMQPLKTKHKGIDVRDFDIDAAIKRNPEIILVDELAHTNVEGCRHKKRYQDIEELLKAGIDVYTTVNVQHLESLNDVVASITGVLVRERIPDHVFDGAEQVELVDIEPEELIRRLNEGKIYVGEQKHRAIGNFFSIENLIALREIALRRSADRVNRRSERNKLSGGDAEVEENILVCISPSASNSRIIRTAARMANVFKGSFMALYVETPKSSGISEKDKEVLRNNMRLAEQLGAKIEIVYGDDVPFQIAEFARMSGTSKIILGKNNWKRNKTFGGSSLGEKLTRITSDIEICIIPNRKNDRYKAAIKPPGFKFEISDLIKSIAILLSATFIGVFFYEVGFSEANTITIYILSVLITAVVTTQRIYSLVSSILSVLVFNFVFTEPRFTLNAYDAGYATTFFIMFVSAFITSSLAVKIKESARQTSQKAFRTKILLETNQLLQSQNATAGIVAVTVKQLMKLLGKDIVFYAVEDNKLGSPTVFMSLETDVNNDYISENEKAVAAWVFKNNKHAGATTNTLGNAKCLYLAVRVKNKVYGVVGIVTDNEPLEAFENSVVLSVLGECALAMENKKVQEEREEAAVLAKNEQLRANLLRAISHDLRTPLTSISGNAGILLSSGTAIAEDKKIDLYKGIYDDSLWLINLVENLLSVTRLSDGTMNLNFNAELVEEVVEEALSQIKRRNATHNIIVNQKDEFLLAKMDARLIMQVIINIVENAIKYTEEGSNIEILVRKIKDEIVVDIADNGNGISDESKEKIFDMFYTDNKLADSRRSLGLGLALCKSIILAHEGEISVFDNIPKGTVFRFTLPAEEVVLHE
ncbi:MAG: sensor histidine kinase KdpD [Anaerovoracaceae bacterium]